MKSVTGRKRWAERKMWEKRRGEGKWEEMSRVKGWLDQRGSVQQGGRGGKRGRKCRWISDEFRVTLIDQVKNHGLTMSGRGLWDVETGACQA